MVIGLLKPHSFVPSLTFIQGQPISTKWHVTENAAAAVGMGPSLGWLLDCLAGRFKGKGRNTLAPSYSYAYSLLLIINS